MRLALTRWSSVSRHAIETTSPRDYFVFPAREHTCRPIRAEQRHAHRLASALLESSRARIVVEVGLDEARRDGVDLDPLWLQLDRHSERNRVERRLGRRVDGAEGRAV